MSEQARAALHILAKRKTEKTRIVSQIAPEEAHEHLIAFSQYTDPDAALWYDAKHLRLVAEKLEAVERGEIKRLMLFLPPRHWKSSLTSEKFPAWYLGRNPKKKIISTSFGADLVEGFSRSVRSLVSENELYRNVFPDVKIRKGYESVTEWALEGAYRSSYRAAGIGGAITGQGADVLLIDDPVADAQAVATKALRDKTFEYYRTKLRNRLEPGGAVILIMTRWHEDDLAGRLLKMAKEGQGEEWEVVCLPAIAEPGYKYSWQESVASSETDEGVSPAIVEQIDAIGRREGEVLWPERFDLAELDALKLAQGSRAWSALYQQRPRNLEGQILDSMLLKRIDEDKLPAFVKIVRRWDLAFSENKGADRLSGAKVGRDAAGNYYILHMKVLQGRWTVNKPKIIQTALDDGAAVTVGIEANGTQLGYYQDIHDDEQMGGRKVEPDKPVGSKETRADIWGSRLPDGIVYVVRGTWNQALFDEMDEFPFGEHDDQVDGISGAWQMLNAPVTTNALLPSARYAGIKRT